MKLLTANMKMADVVHSNYLLMPVIGRFGIPFGFGEKTVYEVCKKCRVDIEFFLAIINAFSHEEYFPERKLQTFNVLMIINYLEKAHSYYIKTQVPLIEKLINDLIRHRPADKKNLGLIKKFFIEYRRELLVHLKREERVTFPYIKKVYKMYQAPRVSNKEKRTLTQYSMHVYEEEHSDVDEKLFDLKNILIKYVRGDSMQALYHEVIFELFRLEKDIQDHTRIENKILLPLVADMEDELFYPKEHSRRTAGSSMLQASSQIPIQDSGSSPFTKHTFELSPLSSKHGIQKLEGLSSREIEVLQLVACGFLNKEIADQLSISLHTVISHRKNITRKLQIKTVAGLTIYALLNGLISSKNIN
ncbi:MAG: LuxR C-terminal-related transcriptional regulator [Ignavibacteriales bacterium]|nr:LuxR C-terminal-related transcriptional regulator [Ignavibacteriales bacterium]